MDAQKQTVERQCEYKWGDEGEDEEREVIVIEVLTCLLWRAEQFNHRQEEQGQSAWHLWVRQREYLPRHCSTNVLGWFTVSQTKVHMNYGGFISETVEWGTVFSRTDLTRCLQRRECSIPVTGFLNKIHTVSDRTSGGGLASSLKVVQIWPAEEWSMVLLLCQKAGVGVGVRVWK